MRRSLYMLIIIVLAGGGCTGGLFAGCSVTSLCAADGGDYSGGRIGRHPAGIAL